MEDMSSSEPDDASCFSALMPSGVAPSDDRFAEPALVPEDLLRVLAIRGTRPLSPPRPVPGDPLTPPRCVPRSAESRSTEYRSGRRPPAAPRRDRRGAEEAPANSAFALGPDDPRGTAPRDRAATAAAARCLLSSARPLLAASAVRRAQESTPPLGQPDDGISRSRAAAAPRPPRAAGRRNIQVPGRGGAATSPPRCRAARDGPSASCHGATGTVTAAPAREFRQKFDGMFRNAPAPRGAQRTRVSKAPFCRRPGRNPRRWATRGRGASCRAARG